jgi:hypothetical protein
MKSSKLVSCLQAVLAPELVEARHAALAVADDVEGGHVDPVPVSSRSIGRFCRNWGGCRA